MPSFGRTPRRPARPPKSWHRFQGESLELRCLLAFSPSGLEQEFLEQINRMRIAPAEELGVLFNCVELSNPSCFSSHDADVNLAMSFFNVDKATLLSQWSSLSPTAPVAWNAALGSAAVAHSELMVAHNTQSHQLPGESSLLTRIVDAGYQWTGSVSVGENVFAYAESVFHGHAAFAIDWGSTPSGIQSPPGHRLNIMDSRWVEVGVGVVSSAPSGAGDVGPLIVTQDFGYRGNYGTPQLLGVVFDDLDQDGRYDNGEGRGGVTITATSGGSSYTTTTMEAGGYQLALDPGTYTVTASGGGLAGPVTLGTAAIAGDNVKLDLALGDLPQTATLSGIVFRDINEDGLIDASEPRLSGFTIFLDQNGNQQLDAGEASSITNTAGQYTLTVDSAGSYDVRLLDRYGFRVSAGGVAVHNVNVALGDAVTGTNFGQYRFIETAGSQVYIYGTLGDDVASWQAGAQHVVGLNGVTYQFDATTYNTVRLFGRGGTDSLTLRSGAANDTATIYAGLVNLVGGGATVSGSLFENLTVDLGTGSADYAYFYDTAADDDLIAHPTSARLVGGNYNHLVLNFDRVYAFAHAGGNNRAYMYDGPTNDRFVGRRDFSLFQGENMEFYYYMEGFGRNFAFSTRGGLDSAFFYDSPGDDDFFARGTTASMQDKTLSYYNYATGFGKIFAYATLGGTDSAFFTDTAGDDRFFGREAFSLMNGSGYYNYASNFDLAVATAHTGGVDYAYLFGSAGNDILVADSSYALLRAADNRFQYNARGFDQAIAYGQGGHDTATLYDAAGDDLFFGRQNYGYMSGAGFFNRADDFDEITAHGTGGGVNRLNVLDVDYLFTSPGSWV